MNFTRQMEYPAVFDEFDLLALRSPAGTGQENNPDDIESLDRSLRQIEEYEPPAEYANGPQRYATAPMINALERFQERNGLKRDGFAIPGGPTERAINNRLLKKPLGAGFLYDLPAPITEAVGNGFANRRADVQSVQRKLGALGYMPEDPFDRPHGLIDAPTLDGLLRFQRNQGLTPDGWAAPGGETERALDAGVDDVARKSGAEWLRFIERARRAQTGLAMPLAYRNGLADAKAAQFDRAVDTNPEAEDDEGVIPVQSRGVVPWIWPTIPPPNLGQTDEDGNIIPGSPADVLARIFRGFAYGGHIANRPTQRTKIDAGDRTEFVPPSISNAPYAGPAEPPIDPRQTGPAPFPVKPLDLPNKEENIPPQPKRGDHIIVLPDPSQWIAQLPIVVENRIGDPPVQDLNRTLGTPIVCIGESVFGEGNIKQIGGPKPHPSTGRFYETFDRFRYKKEFGTRGNTAGSFEDVTFLIEYNGVTVKFIINTVNTGVDGTANTRESRQRAKMVLNTLDNTFIAEVDKPSPKETIDMKAWQGFVESRMQYVKYLIDNKIIEAPDPKKPAAERTHKILDFFRYYGGRL